jgi:hypothetical protein
MIIWIRKSINHNRFLSDRQKKPQKNDDPGDDVKATECLNGDHLAF